MKAIIFDVDGTLTGALSSYPNDGFKQHPQDVIVLPGVVEGMQFHHSQGYVMVGASNQGGCSAINAATGKPHKSIEDAIAEMKYTLELLPLLQAIYFCPDFQGDALYKVSRDNYEAYDRQMLLDPILHTPVYQSYRKPGSGMIQHAINDFKIDKNCLWMIGDRAEDMEAADNANCEFMNAETWRMRFSPGYFQKNVNSKELEFLEGFKYKVETES
jgi:D-glycero-D-manno-heptose 1,7-bisphosphate phosphatase